MSDSPCYFLANKTGSFCLTHYSQLIVVCFLFLDEISSPVILARALACHFLFLSAAGAIFVFVCVSPLLLSKYIKIMHIVYLAEFENVMTSAYNASHKNLIEKGDL